MQVTKYLTKKQFHKVKKNKKTLSIVGQTNLSKWKDKYSKKETYQKLVEPEQQEAYLVKPKVWGLVNKYVQVGPQEYVVVKHRLYIIVLILLLTFFLGMCLDYISCDRLPDLLIGGEDIEEYRPQYEVQEDMIEVPGLAQNYVIDKNNQEIYLVNPAGNSVYFKYFISLEDTNKCVYESSYIPSNKMERANLYELFPKGEYDLILFIETIDEETQEQCNSAQLETHISVK